MSKKYKILLNTIAVIIVSILVILGGYFIYKYNKEKNSAEVIVSDNLSFNYMNGRKIEFSKKEKTINFSVINDSEDAAIFHININKIKFEGKEVFYELYENNKLVVKKTSFENNSSTAIFSFISIEGSKTKSYKLKVYNPDKEDVSFEIELLKSSGDDANFSRILLNDNKVAKEPKTKVGEELAVTDEGLILDVDDNGNTYYFRGNSTTNYFKLADKLWRIVRINGNGTVKLVLDGISENSTIYGDGTTDRLTTLKKLSNTKLADSLNNWYNENLKDYDKYIYDYNFCIDTNKEDDNLSNYLRVSLVNNPTFNCLGTTNTSKIGLLTIDEVIYAGAKTNEMNNYFYLYNPEITVSSWTLSPSKDSVEGLYYYELTSSGGINSVSTGESSKALRPVINLKKDVEVVGKGTKEEPYSLK